jgi:hypothetical protein
MNWTLVGKTYRAWLSEIERLFSVGYLIRVSLAMSILGSIALLLTDQSMEMLRVLAEDRKLMKLIFFALSALFLSLMSWYWARVLLYVFEPSAFEEKGGRGWAARNLPRICAEIPFLAIALAFYRLVAPQPYVPESRGTVIFIIFLLVLSFAVAILLHLFFLARRRVLERLGLSTRSRMPRSTDPLTLSRQQIKAMSLLSKLVLLLTLVLGLLLFVVFSVPGSQVRVTPAIGPASIVLLCIGTMIPFGSMIVYLGKLTRLPLISVLLIAALLFSILDFNDNHRIRQARPLKRSPLKTDQAFAEWLKNRADLKDYKDKKKPYPVFIVSAEGGGLRAAYFTALALSAAQDRYPTFAQHVFAISGVSGGSVGAAVFTGLTARYTKNQTATFGSQPAPASPRLQDKAEAILKRDFLSPLLAAGLYPDLAQRFLPFPIGRFDRARALERGFEHAWTSETDGDEFSNSFHDLWKDFPRESVPALFLNTTRVETGERMIISNLSTHDDPNITWIENLADIDSSISLPLSTAACLSARFPFITPAGYVIKSDKGGHEEKYRFVDGGYFENSGTATLLDIFSSIHSNKIIDQISFKIVLIRIGFVPSARTRYARQGVAELMTPFRTLLNTREARGATAIRQTKIAILPLKNSKTPADMVSFELTEGQVPLPLGWLLSNKACLEMKRQWEEMHGIDEIGKFLG